MSHFFTLPPALAIRSSERHKPLLSLQFSWFSRRQEEKLQPAPRRALEISEGREQSVPSEHLALALKPDFQDREVIGQGFRAAELPHMRQQAVGDWIVVRQPGDKSTNSWNFHFGWPGRAIS
jgi:hypothetical protein